MKSVQASESITRKSASNLTLAFFLLPKSKRAGMSALYAFCRRVDDVADEDAIPVEERRRQLQAWRQDIRLACSGGTPAFDVNQELQPAIREYKLPFSLFDELIQGVEADLDIHRYPDYPELELYCYRVASVVGLLSIEIFGYQNEACKQYAVHLGKALQLTNILRDVGVDADRGRVYLPQSALRRHGVAEEDILNRRYSERFRALAEEVATRAREFYRQAREILPVDDRRSMATAESMGSVYWRLLKELEARRFDVLGSQPTRLSKLHKLFLVLRTWRRVMTGTLVPNYGVR